MRRVRIVLVTAALFGSAHAASGYFIESIVMVPNGGGYVGTATIVGPMDSATCNAHIKSWTMDLRITVPAGPAFIAYEHCDRAVDWQSTDWNELQKNHCDLKQSGDMPPFAPGAEEYWFDCRIAP